MMPSTSDAMHYVRADQVRIAASASACASATRLFAARVSVNIRPRNVMPDARDQGSARALVH